MSQNTDQAQIRKEKLQNTLQLKLKCITVYLKEKTCLLQLFTAQIDPSQLHIKHVSEKYATFNNKWSSDHIVAQQANRYIVAFHIAISRYRRIRSGLDITGGL